MAGVQEPLLGGSGGDGNSATLPGSPFQGQPTPPPLAPNDGGAACEDATAEAKAASAAIARRIALAIYLSLAVNVLLMVIKAVAFLASGSMAVLASAIDTLIDLLSQAVISAADWAMARKDERYPAGKSRLESISVIACAFVMTLGCLSVVQESAVKLYEGFALGELPRLALGPLMFGVLALATILKLPLYFFCAALTRYSGAAEALAEDHINDVFANLGAIATAAVAAYYRQLWWTDPAGGILISLVIIWRWAVITACSIAKVVGVTAAPDELELLRALAEEHHPQARVGFLRAYHAGQRVAVDCELEAPAHMAVLEAAAIARELKEKLEALPEVESASVLVVPLGTHAAPDRALLLTSSVAKPPGAADPVGDALLAESPALSRLASAYLAAAPSWRPASPRGHALHHPPSGQAPTPAAVAAAAAGEEVGDLEAGLGGGGGGTAQATTAAPAAAPAAAPGAQELARKPPAGPSSRHLAGPSTRRQDSGLQPERSPPSLARWLTAPVRRTPTPTLSSGIAAAAAEQPPPPAREPSRHGYAERVAWMRALRDAPDRGLRGATFRRRDTAELLAALDRRPSFFERGMALEDPASPAAAAGHPETAGDGAAAAAGARPPAASADAPASHGKEAA